MLTVAMPLCFVGALAVSLISTPSGYRARVLGYLLIGIFSGLFGAHVIQPIQPGGWNYQFLFYPFLYAKWLFIGFTTAWGLGNLTIQDQRKSLRGLSAVILGLAAIPLLLTLLDLTSVPSVFQRDRAYWENVFSTPVSDGELRFASDRLSSEGRERVSWYLHYHPHEIPAPVLTKLHALGFSVLHARQIPSDIITADVAAVQAKLDHEPEEWKKSQIVSELTGLASNPAIDEKTFQLLATIGDYQVVSALIRNESNDDVRIEWLRQSIETRVAESKATTDSDRWYVDRLREQHDHLEHWWNFKKTGEWKTFHQP